MRCPLLPFGVALFAFSFGAVAQQPAPNTSPAAAVQRTAKPSRQPKIVRHHSGRQHPQPVGSQTQYSSASSRNIPANNKPIAYSDAVRRYHHARHDRFWWRSHFNVIVLVSGGYYYWDGGYWYPAWGYDPAYQYYDYDGPIFTYGNLLPDQVIANVQKVLKQLGYYTGGITGSLGPTTRAAIAAFQEDNGLDAIGVIDGPTVAALGLIS